MDPLAFPVLAGTVLTEAVKFLFDRAAAVLDRRSGRVAVEQPELLPAQAEPLMVRPNELTDERITRITEAHGALRVFLSRPEFLNGEDSDVRQQLGQLRRDLEEIYGRQMPFGDEAPEDRPEATVSQYTDSLRGKQTGMRVRGVTGHGKAHIEQEAGTIEETGEQVGIVIDGTIG